MKIIENPKYKYNYKDIEDGVEIDFKSSKDILSFEFNLLDQQGNKIKEYITQRNEPVNFYMKVLHNQDRKDYYGKYQPMKIIYGNEYYGSLNNYTFSIKGLSLRVTPGNIERIGIYANYEKKHHHNIAKPDFLIVLKVRECIPGEHWSYESQSCNECPEGKYSFEITKECK